MDVKSIVWEISLSQNMISTMKTSFRLRATVIFVLGAASFAPCLRGTFVFDDIPAVVENKIVHSKDVNLSSAFLHDFWGEPTNSDKSHGSYRPLTTLLFRELFHSLDFTNFELFKQ